MFERCVFNARQFICFYVALIVLVAFLSATVSFKMVYLKRPHTAQKRAKRNEELENATAPKTNLYFICVANATSKRSKHLKFRVRVCCECDGKHRNN